MPEAAAPTITESRRHQIYPELSPADIERVRRFGQIQHFHDGDLLFTVGRRDVGMFVLISGKVAILRHDGLGRGALIVEQGPGQLLAEIAQLSGRPWSMARPSAMSMC